MNTLRTGVLLAALTAIFMLVGFMLGGEAGMLLALVVAAGMNVFAYWNSDKIVLRMYKAREVDRASAPGFYGIVEQLAENAYVRQVLESTGLTTRFMQVGYQLAATVVELFADLPPDHELFQQFSFVSADDLPEVQALLQRADRDNLGALAEADLTRLISLPFMLVPARHRLGLIDEDFQAKILEAREVFARDLPEDLGGAVEFFQIDRYNRAANLQDNILFGKIAYGLARAADRVGGLIGEVIEELDLRDVVSLVGLDYEVGIAGSRLSSSQRQKLAHARAILKRPDVLILFESIVSLDSVSQSRIMEGILAEFEGRSVIWCLHRPDVAEQFDMVLAMRQGKVAEQGTFEELNREGTFFHELLGTA